VIKKLLVVIIIVAIGATAAYQMGWLSRKGEKAYDRTKESVLEKGEEIVDKAKDAMESLFKTLGVRG
jgi:hypothetical protein